MKFNHIIHPTDFSEASLNAFEFACGLAKEQDATLHLVHVFEQPVYTVASNGGLGLRVDPTALNELRQEINEEIKKLANKPFAKDVKLRKRLISDIDVWKFYEELNPKEADLIVMGTRGATGLLHGGIVGTNTERVIRYSDIPVLSVPDEFAYRVFDNILFATDFKDDVTEAFQHVVDMAKVHDAQVTVGVINTRSNFNTSRRAQDKYEALLRKVPYNKAQLVVHNDEEVAEGIQDLVMKLNSDMIAMITHGRTGIAHLLRGSIAEDVSATIAAPLLTFKIAKKENKD